MWLSVLWQQKPISCCERKQNARKEKATIACIALLARATPEKHIARLWNETHSNIDPNNISLTFCKKKKLLVQHYIKKFKGKIQLIIVICGHKILCHESYFVSFQSVLTVLGVFFLKIFQDFSAIVHKTHIIRCLRLTPGVSLFKAGQKIHGLKWMMVMIIKQCIAALCSFTYKGKRDVSPGFQVSNPHHQS